MKRYSKSRSRGRRGRSRSRRGGSRNLTIARGGLRLT